MGYSPWGPKESDTTERLHFHFARYFLQITHYLERTGGRSSPLSSLAIADKMGQSFRSEVKVPHLCPTLCDPIVYSPLNFLGQNTGLGGLSLLQGIVPTQRLNPGLPHCSTN